MPTRTREARRIGFPFSRSNGSANKNSRRKTESAMHNAWRILQKPSMGLLYMPGLRIVNHPPSTNSNRDFRGLSLLSSLKFFSSLTSRVLAARLARASNSIAALLGVWVGVDAGYVLELHAGDRISLKQAMLRIRQAPPRQLEGDHVSSTSQPPWRVTVRSQDVEENWSGNVKDLVVSSLYHFPYLRMTTTYYLPNLWFPHRRIPSRIRLTNTNSLQNENGQSIPPRVHQSEFHGSSVTNILELSSDDDKSKPLSLSPSKRAARSDDAGKRWPADYPSRVAWNAWELGDLTWLSPI